jgi:hypothetical protein
MPASAGKRPNLFVIGAMKCGTTSLHRYLHAHPDIFMSEFKEPGYFVEELNWYQGDDWYLSLFDGADKATYRGESSTHYTKLPLYQGVAQRIADYNPDARFIYAMRHPFERMVSHYWHEVRQLHSGGETRDIYSACMQSPQYQAFSHYAKQLQPFIDRIPRENLYCTTFESLKAAPDIQMAVIFEWLNLDNTIDTSVLSKRHNARPDIVVGASGNGLLNKIRHSQWYDNASRHIPKSIRSRASQMSQTTITLDSQREGTEKLRYVLQNTLERQVDELCQLTGQDFKQFWTMT